MTSRVSLANIANVYMGCYGERLKPFKGEEVIIDCHTHINPASDNIGTSEHLEAAETVDACIVLANADSPSEEVNKKLSEYVNRHSEKMVGFAFIEPTRDKISVNDLKSIVEELGLKGAVLYCSACGFHPAHSQAMCFYESAQELGLPVFFHNGYPDLSTEAVLEYAQPYLLDEIARTFPNLRIVIGTMGFPFVEQTLSIVAKHKSVYADLTIRPGNVWQIYNIVMAAHERKVMHKLLFGSGFPHSKAGECMEALLGFNMVLADTNLPTVPRGSIRSIIDRNSLGLLGVEHQGLKQQEMKSFVHMEDRTNK